VSRAEVDPVYFSTPDFVYPDGPIAVETFRVIGAAIADAGEVGIGHITLSRRERLVMVEPRSAGMVLITLRASEEVKAAAFEEVDTDVDADMVLSPRRSASGPAAISTRPPSGIAIRRRCAS
jgi:non-homologous end joining protein Ku